jgi:hypothetical protein
VTRASFILAVAVAMTTTPPLRAQDRYLTAAEYSVAIPLGDTHRFDASGSWSGANWEGRWMGWPYMSVGTLIGFNEFYDRQSGTFDFPGGAATGEQYRHLLVIPAVVTAARYFTATSDDPRWYIGAGAGIQYTQQSFQLGLQEKHRSNWGVVLVPEIGLAFAAWYGTGGIVSLRYHLPTESSSFLGSGQRRFQYISLSAGFGYR